MPDRPPDEKETRQDLIDSQLSQAGWDVSDCSQVIEEFLVKTNTDAPHVSEQTNTGYGKKTFSDYVLLGKDGKPLAVVEAKRSSKDAELGREQAKQYCEHIAREWNCDLPFCFYTNGYDIFFWGVGTLSTTKGGWFSLS